MATDNFNRSNGVLGSNWTAHNLGGSSGTGLTIAGNQVKGTDVGTNVNGNIWTASSFGNDQFSEMTVATSSLSPNGWIGVTARALASGPCYMAIYFNASGTYKVQLYYSSAPGNFTLLGAGASSFTLPGALSVGDKVKLQVVGHCISCLVNGVEKMSYYDSTISSGGGPGVAIAGSSDFLDDWSGGSQAGEFHLVSTDGNGVEGYTQISKYNSHSGANAALNQMRVKKPTSPAGGKAHNFLYVMPVTAEGNYATFGDGINYIRGLNAHNDYNITLIEPSFWIEPWYGNHATDPDIQYESFFVNEVKPWVTANLSTTGNEKHWVIGFSKSGFGPTSIWFKNPTLFHVGAFWDFPAQGFTGPIPQFGNDDLTYGTDANFQANYRMTDAFLDTYKVPFQSQNRLWISGYNAFQTDVANWDTKLTAKGIKHTYGTPALITHAWTSGWVPAALAALDANSIALSSVTAPTRENAVNAQANGPNAIDLAWAPTGAANYIIERKSTP